MKKKIGLVTGANRGLGFAICKQLAKMGYVVILTGRSQKNGEKAVQKIGRDNVVFKLLDVTDLNQIQNLARQINEEYGRLDLLVNNAGINPENSSNEREISAFNANYNIVLKTLETNTISVLKMINGFAHLLEESRSAWIINISSSMGQLASMKSGSIGYRLSKTGVNVITKVMAEELLHSSITVAAISPGWVRTRMGSEKARFSTEEAAKNVLSVLKMKRKEVHGKFMYCGTIIPW